MKKNNKVILLLLLILTLLSVYIISAETPLSLKGTLPSKTGTPLNLVIEYEISQTPGSDTALIKTKVFLDYVNLKIVDERVGTLMINNISEEFVTGKIWVEDKGSHHDLLFETEKIINHKWNEKGQVDFYAKWHLGGSYSGKYLGWIEVNESVSLTNLPADPKTPEAPQTPAKNEEKRNLPKTIYRNAAEIYEKNPVYDPNDPNAPFMMTGTITSNTGTNLTLRVEWEAVQKSTEPNVTITAKVYIDYIRMYISARNGSVNIGGVVKEFTSSPMNISETENHTTLLTTHSAVVKREWNGSVKFTLSAKWYLGAPYTEIPLEWVTAEGTIILSDKYKKIPQTANIAITPVMQAPELPNGCEITSLTAVLNYLKYGVDKLTMTDKYLDIGVIGSTDYNKASIGNPRNTDSFGAYAPVIINAAEKYLKDNENKHKTYNLTGYNIDEIYYQVSQGNPIIVWITEDLNKKPMVTKTWIIGGNTIHWKSPLHCTVLCGYDLNNKTVTVADPKTGVTTYPMDLFELRWNDMGAQAVMIK